jgi:acylphosphatase
MSEQKAIHIIVHGYVQGVGFRYFTKTQATHFSLVGWVRNNYDSTVEIWAEGAKLKLEQFIQAVHPDPGHGAVDKLDIDWHPAKGETLTFTIRY